VWKVSKLRTVFLPFGPPSCESVDVTDVIIMLTGEIQGRLSSLTEQEKVSREQCIALRSTVSALESRLAAVTKEATQYKTELELQQARFNQLQQAKDRYVQAGYRVEFMYM
jgi:chromosome segregation ATPase